MIPIRDENPSSTTPYMNYALIIINAVAFLLTLLTPDPNAVIDKYGLRPADVVAGTGLVTFLTSMFLHGGLLHIGGNMLFLYIFGDNIEDTMGHAGYVIFYLAAGVAGSLAHIASDPNSTIVAIGASGAISGVLGAYVRYFPNARIRTAVTLGFWIQFVKIPAYLMIGFWFFYQLLLAILDLGGGVAYFAHIGGFIAGLALALIIPRRKRSEWPA